MQADIHRMLASKDNPKGEGSSVFRGNASKYLRVEGAGEGVSVVSAVDQGITTTTTTYQEKENTTDRGGLRMQGNAIKYLRTAP